MLGNLTGAARKAFFEHLLSLDAWKGHPVMANPEIDLEALIPFCFHADGAQFYRDDENFVWSVSSAFGAKGAIKDVLMTKYPMAIVPEKFMRDHDVLGLNIIFDVCYLFFCDGVADQCLAIRTWITPSGCSPLGTCQHQQALG